MQGNFYDKGLSFTCVRCSRCCRIEPGFVFLSARDCKKMADFFSIAVPVFLEKYCRIVDIGAFKRYSLREKDNYDCIFWENGKCIVYESRPRQCSSYPFWPANLMDAEAWNSLQTTCPGINQGKKHSKKDIKGVLALRQEEPLISL
ncbi:MAG: YkgJ family cysteine cluster protein [Spirochaetales bacterium]|nr:MAG: YkgJ family cysteine cluster protein [Spirochaetales bacterium]